ncbi:MAG: Dabb family protein [Planctomycetaceae bacterium]
MNNRRLLTALTVSAAIFSCAACSDTATDESETATTDAAETESPETTDTGSTEERPGQLLRHAVFFKFKESSSAEDVQGVVDAFRALPEKLSSIVGFQYGTNNSPEDHDDGFTHCFLLSFKTASDRDEYIVAPAHSGEFADVLRPHMEAAFVVDYWGDVYEPMEKELKHCVFFKFKDDADPADVKKVEEAFAALPSKIDGIKAFEWGTNNSPEKNDDGFTHCFMVTFDSEAGREQYLPHPDHKAFVEVLLPVLDKVRVLDFWDGE